MLMRLRVKSFMQLRVQPMRLIVIKVNGKIKKQVHFVAFLIFHLMNIWLQQNDATSCGFGSASATLVPY
jgi:hypothetical protein